MKMEQVANLWQSYLARQVDMTLHPDDHMNRHHQGNLDKYNIPGTSGAKVIASALAMSPTDEVRSVLDFGCGHGRVARHLRALFPDAKLYFSDIDEGASRFCASQFGGEVAESRRDFSQLRLPKNLDLIWVGSVFTHISVDRMEELFSSLFGCLARSGILVATFHGEWALKVHSRAPLIAEDRWQKIVAGYEATGVGHYPYGGANGTDHWGISLIKPERALSLAKRHGDASQIAYLFRAWANFHDVAVWARS